MSSKTPESAVVASCLELLYLMSIPAWRNNTGALRDDKGRLVRYGKKGSADIIGILPDGRFLSVECKRPGAKARPEQIEFMNTIKQNNGVACVVHCFEELMEVLKKEGVAK